MEGLRKITNILVILFLVFAVLVLFNIISTSNLDATFSSFNPENFYKTIFVIGAELLLLYLLLSNMSMLALKREKVVLNNKITELKASLYDKKEETIRQQPREDRPAGPTTPNPSKPDPIFPPDSLQ